MRYFQCVLLCMLIAASVPCIAWERHVLPADPAQQLRSIHGWEGRPMTTGEIYGWRATLHGDLNIDGLNIDLEGNADFEAKNLLGFALTHGVSRRSSIALSYNSFDYTGTIRQGVKF